MFQFVQVAVHTHLMECSLRWGCILFHAAFKSKYYPRIFVLGSREDTVSALLACGCTWETFSHLFVFHLSWSEALSHACRPTETQDNKQHVHVTVNRTLPSGSVRTSLYVCRNSDLRRVAAQLHRIFCLPAVSCCSHSCCVATVFGNTFHFF